MQVDDAFVVDTTAREEEAADQACHIAVTPSGTICGMFRGNSTAISPFALQVASPAQTSSTRQCSMLDAWCIACHSPESGPR